MAQVARERTDSHCENRGRSHVHHKARFSSNLFSRTRRHGNILSGVERQSKIQRRNNVLYEAEGQRDAFSAATRQSGREGGRWVQLMRRSP